MASKENASHDKEGNKEGGFRIIIKQKLTIVIIITNDHLLRLAILAHLAPEVLVEGVEVVLQLGRVHLVFGVVGRVLVEVGQQNGLRIGRLDVLARAAVAVAAGADFVVETAVHFVLFGAEDGGEVAVMVVVMISRAGMRKGRGTELTWPS